MTFIHQGRVVTARISSGSRRVWQCRGRHTDLHSHILDLADVLLNVGDLCLLRPLHPLGGHHKGIAHRPLHPVHPHAALGVDGPHKQAKGRLLAGEHGNGAANNVHSQLSLHSMDFNFRDSSLETPCKVAGCSQKSKAERRLSDTLRELAAKSCQCLFLCHLSLDPQQLDIDKGSQ